MKPDSSWSEAFLFQITAVRLDMKMTDNRISPKYEPVVYCERGINKFIHGKRHIIVEYW